MPVGPKSRDAYLRRTYGISQRQYETLFKKQEGACAVCGRHQRVFPQRLSVDHDHKTREIRGLLCSWCNHRVVGRHRDAVLLQRVADYLKGPWTGWIVPEKPKKKKRRKKK